jgi:catechol 2,3-dioxygenase-like lactoylglutathione lyase family enzyme
MIESISAITLATHDMARAVRFYRMLGFEVIYGGDDAAFTSFRAGTSYLNLIAQPAERTWSWWGRVILALDSRHHPAQPGEAAEIAHNLPICPFTTPRQYPI